jgi:hypothetical protein
VGELQVARAGELTGGELGQVRLRTAAGGPVRHARPDRGNTAGADAADGSDPATATIDHDEIAALVRAIYQHRYGLGSEHPLAAAALASIAV